MSASQNDERIPERQFRAVRQLDRIPHRAIVEYNDRPGCNLIQTTASLLGGQRRAYFARERDKQFLEYLYPSSARAPDHAPRATFGVVAREAVDQDVGVDEAPRQRVDADANSGASTCAALPRLESCERFGRVAPRHLPRRAKQILIQGPASDSVPHTTCSRRTFTSDGFRR